MDIATILSLKNFAEQLALQNPGHIQGAWRRPLINPWYQLLIHFDPETGIEVARSYQSLIDGTAFEPKWEYEKLTIDVARFRDEGRFIVTHPYPNNEIM